MTYINAIRRPALLLDKKRCLNNIRRISLRGKKNSVAIRPHFKTHQSIRAGEWFRSIGTEKIAVSSVAMASYFAKAGWNDIAIAFPVNLREIEQINTLLSFCHLQLLVEDPQVISSLNSNIEKKTEVYMKIDVGSHRTGLDPMDVDAIKACAEAIEKSERIGLKGLMSHAGHTYNARSEHELREIYGRAIQYLHQVRETLGNANLIISYGDTPSCSMLLEWPGIDEMRAGNYVFYDCMQQQIGSCSLDDIAVALACPIVSLHPQRNEAVVYGGAIHLSKESLDHPDYGRHYGFVVELDDDGWSPVIVGYVRSLSQEHGILTFIRDMPDTVAPGNLIGVLPVHSCMTAQCMGGYLLTDGTPVDHFAGAIPVS